MASEVHLAVTDTHALIWFALGRRQRLGPRALKVFQDAEAGRAAIYVSSLVLAEVFDAAHRGLIELKGGCEVWASGLLSCGSYLSLDLTSEIVIRAEELRAIPERTDRLLAATAAHLDCPLLSRDPEIEAVSGVTVVW